MKLLLFLVLAGSLAASAVVPVSADDAMKSHHFHRTSYRGAPDLQLTLALVQAGGGPANFDAGRLIGVLAGPNTATEVAALDQRYGAGAVKAFVKTFTYAVNDALKVATAKGIALPATPVPDPSDGRALEAALLSAGRLPGGKFDVGYLIEHAVSHDIHVQIMHDMNGDPSIGPQRNAQFHIILTRAIKDLQLTYFLAPDER
ncbi:MAG: hypothetical protein ACREM8_04800 [Vulcanimicrobiaceae bacterium]